MSLAVKSAMRRLPSLATASAGRPRHPDCRRAGGTAAWHRHAWRTGGTCRPCQLPLCQSGRAEGRHPETGGERQFRQPQPVHHHRCRRPGLARLCLRIVARALQRRAVLALWPDRRRPSRRRPIAAGSNSPSTRTAKFSDGQPVTVDDVIFSLELLREHGRPNHRDYYSKVASIERKGERGVRFVFKAGGDREIPLILGLMPVLPRHVYKADNFETPGFTRPDRQRPLRRR